MNAVGRKGQNMFKDLEKKLIPMMEADGGAAGGAETTPEPAGGDDKPMTFDEWLASNPEYQKEFDRRTTKGINTAVTKERDRLNKLHNDQLTEREKLAAMNEEEKRAYEDQKRERELADREAKITRRELEAEAKNSLLEKGLPVEFVANLNFESADTVKAGIEALEKSWAPAIEKTVDERLKGGKPPKDAGTEGDSKSDVKTNEVRSFMKRF